MRILIKLYANLNLGDDLFLKILLDRYPEVKFVLPAPNQYKSIFKNFDNLEIIEDSYKFKSGLIQRAFNHVERYFFRAKYLKKIKRRFSENFRVHDYKFDAFISIGGSIFMQQKVLPVYSSLIYYDLAQQYCKNTFYLGCNFGPYNDPKFFKGYKTIFSKAQDVCFRENLSYNLFSTLDSVRCKPDIVFGLKFSEVIKRNKSVGFSVVRARNGINSVDYMKKYAELIEFYYNKGYEIYLFSFCEGQGDGSTIDSILDLVNNKKNINKVIYNGDIDEFLNIYSSIEQMYCGRFHAMILSMIFNQKIFPITYSSKMLNVLNDIDYQGQTVSLESFSTIQPNDLFEQIDLNFYDIKDFKNKSTEQFQVLDSFIKEELSK
ncbi:polysaccharide pyruvyl transferase family protein [Chryseobacterium aahli]|uniref:polysaccharide pyruvyl transferase family protein n=1 Tax=Chryseobacterium aahli TaxID=1278643 RepID=UPI001F6050CD|nr:polysaccharide pyruvyl transferase family protein [Chryseobacterium aahli]MCI3936496.1 polysaccharide pyruvyl transferase family protein [Chryseobacterium aahli]